MEQSTRLWKKDFIGISLSNFFLFMTFYFLLVSLPLLVIQQFGSSKTEAGLITTFFLFSAILIRPLAGYAIERLGYKKILITSLVIFLGSSTLYFFAETMVTLLVVRFLHGIGTLYILAGIVVYFVLHSRKQTVVQQARQDVSA